ncbi:hypothetical protein [Streptomyces sp. NPDC051684]|uniref:hypothetical protein n=1 Tax=Streptomyces sp. NPDC051684 TaxID=3365670 RepID=UPI0037A2FBBA
MSALQPPRGTRSVEELNEQIRRLILASGGWLSDEQRVAYADLITEWALASLDAPPVGAGSDAVEHTVGASVAAVVPGVPNQPGPASQLSPEPPVAA